MKSLPIVKLIFLLRRVIILLDVRVLQGGVATPEEEQANVQVLCCSFQRYLHCSEQVVNHTCGMDTASFTKGFLDRMSGPLVQVR